jgi:hypothetical protein
MLSSPSNLFTNVDRTKSLVMVKYYVRDAHCIVIVLCLPSSLQEQSIFSYTTYLYLPSFKIPLHPHPIPSKIYQRYWSLADFTAFLSLSITRNNIPKLVPIATFDRDQEQKSFFSTIQIRYELCVLCVLGIYSIRTFAKQQFLPKASRSATSCIQYQKQHSLNLSRIETVASPTTTEHTKAPVLFAK